MEIRSSAGYALGASAALVLLAGCSSGTSSVPSAGLGTQSTHQIAAQSAGRVNVGHFTARVGHGIANPANVGHNFSIIDTLPAGTTLVYVSDASDYYLNAYTESGTLVAQVTGLSEPQGVAVDSKGNVLLANTTASEVLVFSPDLKKVIGTLQDPGEYPAGVAISSTGEVGVTNIISTGGTAGNNSFYKSEKNASKPSSTSSSSDGLEYFFGAFDSKGGFYNDGFNENGEFELDYTAKGSKSAKPITISGATISFPGGVQVTSKGDVVVDDQEGPKLYTMTTKGKVTATTDLSGASDPVSWAFSSKTEKSAWAADAGNAAVEWWAYPAGGSEQGAFPATGQPIGIGFGAK